MDEFKTQSINHIDIEISKTKIGEKWIIRVQGVTSGFVVHTSEDNSTIEFGFDASRIEPHILRV